MFVMNEKIGDLKGLWHTHCQQADLDHTGCAGGRKRGKNGRGLREDREGAGCGGRGDRRELPRRLFGTGLEDDDAGG